MRRGRGTQRRPKANAAGRTRGCPPARRSIQRSGSLRQDRSTERHPHRTPQGTGPEEGAPPQGVLQPKIPNPEESFNQAREVSTLRRPGRALCHDEAGGGRALTGTQQDKALEPVLLPFDGHPRTMSAAAGTRSQRGYSSGADRSQSQGPQALSHTRRFLSWQW